MQLYLNEVDGLNFDDVGCSQFESKKKEVPHSKGGKEVSDLKIEQVAKETITSSTEEKSKPLKKGVFRWATDIFYGVIFFAVHRITGLFFKKKNTKEISVTHGNETESPSTTLPGSLPECKVDSLNKTGIKEELQQPNKEDSSIKLDESNCFYNLFFIKPVTPNPSALKSAMLKTLSLEKKETSLENALEFFEKTLRNTLKYPIASWDTNFEEREAIMSDAKEFLQYKGYVSGAPARN